MSDTISFNETEMDMLRQGRDIAAINHYRRRVDCSIKHAYDVWKSFTAMGGGNGKQTVD